MRPAARRQKSYSVREVTQAASASRAAGASSPSAWSVSIVPPVAPMAKTARMLLQSAVFPLAPTLKRDRNFMAVLTKFAAGRAWSATPLGRVTKTSELAGTACLLRGSRHVLQVLASGRHDRCRYRALDQGRVHQANMTVAGPVFEDVTNGED